MGKKESGCYFKFHKNISYIMLDEEELYKVLSDWLKAVDFVVLDEKGKKISFVEVKRYDYFRDGKDEKIKEVLRKFADSFFIFINSRFKENFCKLMEDKYNLNFILIICPPYEKDLQIWSDKKMILIETIRKDLNKKIGQLLIKIDVTIGEKNLITEKLFEDIFIT